MKKIVFLTFWLSNFIIFTAYGQAAPTPHVISFFMVPCASNPACAKKFPADKLPELIKTHIDINDMILERHLTSALVQGIYVNYVGYITYTDYQGEILLPNKESADTLTVVVTSQIYPVIFQGNTVHHFEIPEEVDATFYHYNLKHDEKNKRWYWNITQLERPNRSQIDNHALVIMAKPKDIEITQGTHESIPGPNFILPDIFVHTSIDTPFCVLKFLKINRFFAPLVIEKKVEPQSFAQAVKA